MGETATLASFVSQLALDDVPDDVVADATLAIRDYVGVALYGSAHEVGERVWRYADRAFGRGPATAFGRGTTTPTGAALANGAFGHAVDYDDTFDSIVIHPTSPVFAATLAASQARREESMTPEVTGRDVLAAYVAGCEAAFRVGHATYPSHYDNGWHATGTVGAFGAAAAAASVLDLDAETTRRAFGVVASCSSALKTNFGTGTKPLHAGHAAAVGVRAARLAEEGLTADPDVLEGDIGYGAVMTVGDDGYDPTAVTEGLGETWAVTDIGFKPYPSGVITHAAMDGMRDLVAEHDLTPETVERVVVTLDEAADEMLIHADADTELEAKFSIEFCLAAVLREGDAGVREFTDGYVRAPETRAAMDLVERDFEENALGGDFAGYGARVRVETVDGETHVAEEPHAPGGPDNPVLPERLREKYDKCARAVLSPEAVDAVAEAVEGLTESPSAAALRAGEDALSTLLRGVAPDAGYRLASADDLDAVEGKPGTRRDLSTALGVDGVNVNIVTLAPGERLSGNAYHRHPTQTELYYVLSGEIAVETEDGGETLAADEAAAFDPGAPHLLHNVAETEARVLAVGTPADGRYPTERLCGHESFRSEEN
ncbi:MmgE/PrpD family protein [Halobaculum gomorrense]|uniref:2-methylcitrate dehydratase PrpD n=1 Tax=Halobaculum gomorrense TaxID=43928 RepID=A0A1M5JLS0_9EURY|nr:MmgE/PrpD family protein [Halobaculum gomorrense]SHG41219.1 2-methylcitrate dehydratase PrpD [Halobaculum gomorrense]